MALSSSRQVHFSPSCILILEHEVVIPHQPSAAGGILRALNPRNLALHLPMVGWSSGSHGRRSSSGEDADEPGMTAQSPPKLALRISNFAGGKKSGTGLVSPVESAAPPPRSILKSPTSETPLPTSPNIPGSYFAPPSPPLTRGRSISSTSSHTPSSHVSPPPPPIQAHPHIPTLIIPLRECCPACTSAAEEAMVAAYKISWTPGAAAKKKRDDAEERGDVLAGLKREGVNIKWGKSLDGTGDVMDDDDDDGFANPVRDYCDEDEDPSEESAPSISASLRATGSTRLLDPLSKLDGTSNISRSSSTSTINKDWTPDKYYDAEDDEDDLFPLPSPSMSPRGTPASGSPSSSAVNLPGVRPNSPLVQTPSMTGVMEDRSPPVSRSSHMYGPGAGLGLPTITGSAPTSPGPGSSRSSVVSLSSAGSHGSGQHRRPSPLREQSSSTVTSEKERLAASTRQPPSRAYISPSASTSSHGGRSLTASSASSGSARVWTSSFVPPPLPQRSSPLHSGHSSRKLEGTAKSPLTRGSVSAISRSSAPSASKKPGDVRGERSNPPPMPTYSGVQREVVIVASSKKGSSSANSASRRDDNPSTPDKGGGEEKPLPALPPTQRTPTSNPEKIRTSSDSNTPVQSRSGSLGPSRASALESQALRSSGRPPAVQDYSRSPRTAGDAEWGVDVDSALSRVSTVTADSAKAFPASAHHEDDELAPLGLTSPSSSPKKRRGSGAANGSPGVLRRAGSANNLRVAMGWTKADEAAVNSARPLDRSGSVDARGHRRLADSSGSVNELGLLNGGGDAGGAPRTRSSSLRRLFRGIGGSLSAAAGVHS